MSSVSYFIFLLKKESPNQKTLIPDCGFQLNHSDILVDLNYFTK